jgi:RNA polymerase sigma factor (sigma-70 family)
MTDWDLVQTYVKDRSDRAFSRLVERHLTFVYQACRRETIDQQVAEDAAVAVFLLLARKAHTIRGGVHLTSWLFSAARLTARNAAQQERRRKAREQKAGQMAQEAAQARRDTAETFVADHLNDALAALSRREREAVLLRYQDGLEVAEVGRALGISESAAQMRLSRGLAKMRRIYAAEAVPLGASVICSALIAAKSEAVPAGLVAKATSVSGIGLAGGVSSSAALLNKGVIKIMWTLNAKATVAAASIVIVGGAATFAIRQAVGAGSNAFDFYVRAGQLAQESGDALTGNNPAADADLVTRNGEALQALRQGLTYVYTNPPVTYKTPTPYYADYRKLARILAAEGRVRSQDGDWNGAVSSGLDAIHLGESIANGSGIIGKLVGMNCCALGRQVVWYASPHLTPQQARAAARRLSEIDAKRVSFGAAMRVEEDEARHWPWTNRQALDRDRYLAFRDQWVMVGAKPYSTKPALPTPQPINLVIEGKPMSLGDNTENQTFARVWLKDNVDQVRTQQLEIGLALQAYHAETGRYPGSLSNLVPRYLPSLPADPFAARGTLQYHLTGNVYALYSVGPDGIDDGGSPIDDTIVGTDESGNRTTTPHAITPDSKGDIVVGVNGW